MADLIKPQDFVVDDADGIERRYIISKFPAVEGREIVAKYPISAMPKLGDYAVNEDTMLKLMTYVSVTVGDKEQRLTTRALINNHVPDFETLAKVEMKMMEYNCSFFRNERLSNSLQGYVQKTLALISKMLTDLSAQSSQGTKPPSTN